MRSVISVDDGEDGCIVCTGLELPKDKMLKIAQNGGILKDSKGAKFDKSEYVFRAEGKSKVKARERALRKERGITTRDGSTSTNTELTFMTEETQPKVDTNLLSICEEAKGKITDPDKQPASEMTMFNLSLMRTSVKELTETVAQT